MLTYWSMKYILTQVRCNYSPGGEFNLRIYETFKNQTLFYQKGETF